MNFSSLVKRWFGKRHGTIRNSRPGTIQTGKKIGAHKFVKLMLEILEDRLAPATVSFNGSELDLTAVAGETITVAPSNSNGVQITSNVGLTDNSNNALSNPYTMPSATTTFNVYLDNAQGQGDTLTFGLGSGSGITTVNIGANPNPGTTPAPGTQVAADTYDSVTLTTTQLSTSPSSNSSIKVNAGTLNFFGSTFVPYVGTVSVQSGPSGEYIITPASGQDWADFGLAQGDTVTLTGVNGTESGNVESSAFNIQVGFNATFTGASCQIANIVGDSLYVSNLNPLNLSYSYFDEDTNTPIAVFDLHDLNVTSGPSLTIESDTGATVSANTSDAQVQAYDLALTSQNSLTVQSTGAPYLGSVTINAAPPTNQPYAGDPYLTGPEWGTYSYAPGQEVSFTDASGNAQTGTVAAVVGVNLYLVMSASPATGTDSTDTVQCIGFTPQISVENNLTLNVTGQGSILGAMDVYGFLNATTMNGDITIQDVDLGGAQLALGSLNAGSGTIELAAVGSIVSSFSDTAAQEVAVGNFNLTASAVDLITTGTSSSIGATTSASASSTEAADLILSTDVGELTATTNDGDVVIQNGGSALTIESVVADQDGQAPTVNDDEVVYNSTPGSSTPTYSPGTSLVTITGAGPILLNSISATGAVTITGEYIVEGDGQSQSIIAPSVDLIATGAANYEGQVTIADTAAGAALTGDTLTLPAGQDWTSYGFMSGAQMAGDPIVISGASTTANDGTFTIQNITNSTLTLQQSYVLDPETELEVTVGNGGIGLTSGSSTTSSETSDAIDLSEVGNFSAQTTNGSIYLALGGTVDSTAASVTAGGTGNVGVTSSGNFLTVENITANGSTVGGSVIGGNVAVTMKNGALIEYPSNNGDAGIINGQNVSLTSPLSIGSASYPLLTNATNGLAVDASATSPSSAAVYVNNTSNLMDVTVSTYDGSVTINDNENVTTGTFINLLSFNNNVVGPNVLLENGSAVVTFANTDDNDGSDDNVLLAGTIEAGGISAGGQILASTTNAPTIDGLMVMLSAGSGIGLPGVAIDTEVSALDATTTTGGINIKQPTTAGTGATVAFKASNGSITSVMQTPVSGGSGYTANSTFYLLVGGGTGGIVQATTDSSGDITFAASPVAGGSGYSTSTSGASTSAVLLLSASTSNGNIDVTAAGSIELIDQTDAQPDGQGSTIQVSAISTNAGGTVTLAAPNGAIYNPSTVSANVPTVTAGALDLTANEIGTAGNSLQTSISSLTASPPGGASSISGGLFLSNNEPLIVSSAIDAGNVSISTTGNLTLDDSLTGTSVDLTATAGAFTATTTKTTNGNTTTTANNGVVVSADTLTVSAEQIGDSSAYSPAGSGYETTDFIQTDATTIDALANYGGIYISNDSTAPLTLTAAAIGPTPGGTVTNNIEVYSAGSIILDPQANALTILEGSQPVGVFNPGGSVTLVVGQTATAEGTPGTATNGYTIASAFCLVSGLSSTSGLTPGMSVSGTDIPAGDVIAVVNPTGSTSDGEVELEYAPTATLSNVSLTFAAGAGAPVTLTGNINGTAPSSTGNSSYFDVESGSWSQDVSNSEVDDNGKAPLVLTQNEVEIVPPPPGGASGSVELITEYQLEQGSGAYQPIAGSIIIDDDLDTSGPATVQITGPLSLTATDGPIVFLNPNDTFDVTGAITINTQTVAVLGNFTSNGGDVSVTTVGNITIGTVNAGSGTVTLTSTSGNVFSSNGGNGTNALHITAAATMVNSAGQPASASQSASLAELNATLAIATADAASAQAAADQTTASAFHSELTAINGQLKSIQTTVANDQQNYQNDLQAANQASTTVTTESNVITAESWSVDGLGFAEAASWLASAIAQQVGTATEDAFLPVAGLPGDLIALLPAVTVQVVASGLNIVAASLGLTASSVQFALTADSNTLSSDESTLASAQAAQDQAYVQLQVDLSTQTALTDEYDATLQAFNTATQGASTEQTIATQDQEVSAQAIAAVVATATPQPMTVNGPLTITDQGTGASDAGIAVTTPITVVASTGLPGATIHSNSPLTVSANITVPGPVDLTAQPELSPETGDDLTVASGVTIKSTGSSVSLTAGNNVVIPAGATIDASTSTITITGDENDDGGANVTVDGTLAAQSALIDVDPNSPGNDTFTITPSATTPITVTGGEGTDTLNVNFDTAGLAVTVSVTGTQTVITAPGMAAVTISSIAIINITDAAGGASYTLDGTASANTMSLVGTGQGAGTVTLNSAQLSFSGVATFNYHGGSGDTISVEPFATSAQVPWNVAVTVAGGSGTPASLTYDSVDSLADTVRVTGQNAGSITSQGLAVVQFSHVNEITTNASQSPGAQLIVNLPGRSSADTANLLSVGSGTAGIQFVQLLGLDVDTADYADLTINGNTVGANKIDLVTNTGAGLSIPLTLNYPGTHSVVNTGAASSVEATATGDVMSVTSAGVVEVADLFGNVSEFAVTDTQLVFSELGNNDTINIAGTNPFTNGIIVDGNASFSDVLNYTAGSDAAVTVTPSTSTVSQAGGGAVFYAGIERVNLAAGGSTSTLTVDGAATSEAFDFTQTGAGVGSFTIIGQGEAIDASPLFTYAGFGYGVTALGGTSVDQPGLSPATVTGNPPTPGQGANQAIHPGLTGNLATLTGYSYVNESVSAVTTVTAGQYAGLVARYTGAGHQNMDLGFVVAGSSSYTAYIYRDVNGTWTSLFSHTYSGSVAADSTLMFDAVGSSLILSLNGNIIGCATDTVLASTAGSAGMWTSSGAVLSNFVAAPVTLLSAGNPFSDNFTTSSADGSLSTYWINQAGAFQVNTSSGTATAFGSAATLATVNGISNANEAVSATIDTLTTGQKVGLVARYGGSGLANMYYGAIVAGSGDYTAYIYRYVNGTPTSLFSKAYMGTATGGVLEFDVVGTSLQLYLNNSIVAYANDSTFTTGSVGMLTSGGAVTVSNFKAAPITPSTASNNTYSDSFSTQGSSVITSVSNGQLDNYWTNQDGDFTTSGTGTATAAAAVDLATVNGISNANEAVSLTIDTLTTGQKVGLVARYGGSGLGNMYYGAIVAGAGDYTAYIYRYVNGTPTPLFSKTYMGTATGGVLEFDVVGTSLQLYLNNSIVAYANDTTYTTGSVGMLTSGGAVTVSNFKAAPITPSTASYPFSNTATGVSPITALSNGQLNSYWSIQSGDYVDNAGTPTGQSSGVNLATVNGVSETTENVSATITLKAGQSAGLVARYAGPGMQNMYYGEIVAGSGTYTVYIYRVVNGVKKQLATKTYHGSVTGAALEFAVSGTSLTLTLNSTTVATATDSTLTGAGSVGILSSGGATISGFSAD